MSTLSTTNLKNSSSGSNNIVLDSSGRVLVGTSTSPSAGALTQYANFVARGNTGGSGFAGVITVGRGEAATSITSGEEIGYLTFSDLTGNEFATIQCAADANAGAGDYPGRLVFSTTADGYATPAEAMRINNQRELLIGTTTRTANGGVLQVSNGITFPATAVACTDVNTLDDYEEGTFAPTAGAGITVNSGTPAYSGFYTKIGRLVHITITQTAGNITATGGSGPVFTNLPFAPGTTLQACSVTNGSPDISGTALIYNATTSGHIYIGFTATAQTTLTFTGTYFI